MPAIYWDEAVMTAVHLLNRSPTSALDGKTLYETWHGRKSAVNYLRIFGYRVFIKEVNHVGKLNDCSSPGVFIDYAEGAKPYRVLDPVTRRVRVASDVVFDEGCGWAWDKAMDAESVAALHDFTVEYALVGGAEGAQGASSSTSGSSSPALTSSSAPSSSSSSNPGELNSPSTVVGSPSVAVGSSSAATLTSPLLVAGFSLLVVTKSLLSSREDDTRSWGNFLVYFSHKLTQCHANLRGWDYILIGC
jgi:hypothetical protein